MPLYATGCNDLPPLLDQTTYQYVPGCDGSACKYVCMLGYVYSGSAGCVEEQIVLNLCGEKNDMELVTLSDSDDGLCMSGSTLVGESFMYSGSAHQWTWQCVN